MYGYNAARTSNVSSRDLPPSAAEAHRFPQTDTQTDNSGNIKASPVVADGVVYIAGDVWIEARDIDTGKRLWKTDPGDSINTSPVVACGTVYVSTFNETLALDQADGAVLWRADKGTSFGVASSPVAVGETIYVAGAGVAALDARTGTERWRTDPEDYRVSPANGVAVDDHVYVGVGRGGPEGITAVTHNGDISWFTSDVETDIGKVYTAPAVANNTVYAVSKTGTVTALAGTDGSIQWQKSVESGVYDPPAVADGRVIVSAGNGKRTMAFDARTGDRLWTFETGVSTGALVITGDLVLATGANTGIHGIDAETGDRIRHWPAKNVGSQPVITNGRLFYRAWNASDVFVIE